MDHRHAVEGIIRGLIDAWNRGDAQGFAAAFAPSAEYVTGSGQRARGREEIAALVMHAGASLPVTLVGKPRMELHGTAGIVRFRWDAAGPGRLRRSGLITCTVARGATGWLIERLENEEEGAASRNG